MAKFGDILKKLRTEQSMSQQKLAETINVSRSYVSAFEQGTREPNLETLEAIADYFNVDMDYLLGRSGIRNRSILEYYLNSFIDEKNNGLSERAQNFFTNITQLPKEEFNEVEQFAEYQRQKSQVRLSGNQKVYHKAEPPEKRGRKNQ